MSSDPTLEVGNLHSRIDIKMSSASLLDEEEAGNEAEHQNITAMINPLIKARILYVAPKSLLIDQKFFKQQKNLANLIKFLKRTSLVDVSLKVLSTHYAHFTGSEHICGKLVFG